MNKKLKKYIKAIALPTLFLVGTFAITLLLTDDKDPYNPMPLGQWFLIKIVGVVLLLACYITVKYLQYKGYINLPTEEE